MNKFVAFLATLAFCVTGTLTNPTGSEADPINIYEYEYDTPLAIDCEWAEWGPCHDLKCGIGSQVFKIFPSVQSMLAFRKVVIFMVSGCP